MAQRMVRANGIDICTESFGDADAPPLLLITGGGESMMAWSGQLCTRLADAGRYVIRFDKRDTGKSSMFNFESEPYNGLDLARDVVGLLDALGIESAHVMGGSWGGMIAQLLAINHRERLRSIILAFTTLDPAPLMRAQAGEEPLPGSLPPPSPEFLAETGKWAAAGTDDADALLQARSNMQRLFVAADRFDQQYFEKLLVDDLAHNKNLASTVSHMAACGLTPPWKDQLAGLDIPTLVIHGTTDPILPFEHGKALAEAIPGAKLLTMEGFGHTLPPPREWDWFIPAILDHTAAN